MDRVKVILLLLGIDIFLLLFKEKLSLMLAVFLSLLKNFFGA